MGCPGFFLSVCRVVAARKLTGSAASAKAAHANVLARRSRAHYPIIPLLTLCFTFENRQEKQKFFNLNKKNNRKLRALRRTCRQPERRLATARATATATECPEGAGPDPVSANSHTTEPLQLSPASSPYKSTR